MDFKRCSINYFQFKHVGTIQDLLSVVLGANTVTAGFEVFEESFKHLFAKKRFEIFQNVKDETALGSM